MALNNSRITHPHATTGDWHLVQERIERQPRSHAHDGMQIDHAVWLEGVAAPHWVLYVIGRHVNPNVALLEATKLAFGHSTDAELANFLKVEHNTIATIRSGKSALGPKPRLKILAQATNAFETDALLSLVESSKELVSLLKRHFKRPNRAPIAP